MFDLIVEAGAAILEFFIGPKTKGVRFSNMRVVLGCCVVGGVAFGLVFLL